MLEKNSDNFFGLSLICHLLYRSLHQAPNSELLSIIYDQKLAENWAVDITNEKLKQGLTLLTNKPMLDEVKSDFAALFVGPDKLKAAPWASVYLNEEQITFGEQTLAIRQCYESVGLVVDTGEHEPDDHIGLIFAFLGHLCELTAQAIENDEKIDNAFMANFLTKQMLTWSPRMLQQMQENAQTSFYQAIALVAEGTLEQLAKLVKAQYLIVNLYR